MDYTTVFDVTGSGYRQWSFPAYGLIFILIALVIPTLISKGAIRKPSRQKERWFRVGLLVFTILWTIGSFFDTYLDYRNAVNALQDGQAKVVEGQVAHYWTVPFKSESFTVQGVTFQYSDYGRIAGFKNTASHGGPIREGLPVKIWYWRGEILRLEIRKKPSL